MLYVLTGLFCLCFTATSYCNMGLALMASTLFSLTDVMLLAIVLEAIFYHITLQTPLNKAFLYSSIGNIIPMAIFLIMIAIHSFITSIFQSTLGNFAIAPELLFFILLCIITTIIKLSTMQRISGYSIQELKYPVIIGNAILFAFMVTQPQILATLTFIVKGYLA